MKNYLRPMRIPSDQYDILCELAEQCLADCAIDADDGTRLFRPDGSGHYDAMWTRDFCYMVEGAGDLMEPEQILAAIDFLLEGQRDDGTIPDRVQADGTPIYCAGPVDDPLGDLPPTDNAQFMVKAVAAYVNLTDDYEAFHERRNRLYDAMDSVPISESALVFVDPNRPHSSYGFTDCIAKTGHVFFSSVLYWEACQTLGRLCRKSEFHDEAHEWFERTEQTSQNFDMFWDDFYGMYFAATQNCRQFDLWGSVYACIVRVPSKKRSRHIAGYFIDLWDECILNGQLRHLPGGEYWEKTLRDVPRDTYQNGGFWATPSGWLAKTMNLLDEEAARLLITDLVNEFTRYGVHEWVNETERSLPGYVASIANVLGAVRPIKD